MKGRRAMLLYHPAPVLYGNPDLPTYFDTHEPFTREETKQYFLSQILLGGSMPSVTRRPFIGKIETFNSPEDENLVFGIKRVGTAENIARQNLSATVRFISQDDSDNYATERDFPIGDLKLETVALALGDWNVVDDNERPVPITRQTIQQYLSPAEFEFVYERCLDVNPMWKNGGEAEVKKS
jgi:hypothetical protein